MVLLGCSMLALGLFGATKFRGELLRPASDEVRRVRLPFALMMLRYVAGGVAFVVAGLAQSSIAVYCGAGILLSSIAIEWLARRRLRDAAS
jgi:hypothetical protein